MKTYIEWEFDNIYNTLYCLMLSQKTIKKLENDYVLNIIVFVIYIILKNKKIWIK